MHRKQDKAESPQTRLIVGLRGTGFAFAVVLAVVAVWLIVTSTSQKGLELGVLAGLWGLLLGACSVFGRPQPRQADALAPGQALDVRDSGVLERADDEASWRRYEVRLEHMLRREIQASLGREMSGLRSEVAALFDEIVENAGGQARLERIETTRVIGTDIEALQREVQPARGRASSG